MIPYIVSAKTSKEAWDTLQAMFKLPDLVWQLSSCGGNCSAT